MWWILGRFAARGGRRGEGYRGRSGAGCGGLRDGFESLG